MVFTFPLPFFTCRELLIIIMIHHLCGVGQISSEIYDINNNYVDVGVHDDVHDDDHGNNTDTEIVEEKDDNENNCLTDLQRPLLAEEAPNDTTESTTTMLNDNIHTISDTLSVDTYFPRRIISAASPKNWLLPDEDRQLRLPGHVGFTITLWLVITGLAIAAPNLGDILDLVGCASGTLIAFVIPALLSFYIEGYNHLAMVLFTVGGVVGTVGTYYSIKQLVTDL